uniref:ULP_PROTEASE domain-containing protein n=1 Tax=Panagrellus redivivus TaxID=6233 RepID=A0A7E4V9E2_PANRE
MCDDVIIILSALQKFRLSEPPKEEHEVESYHECLYFIYCCRNNLRIDLSLLWRPVAKFIFFHNDNAQPTVKDVKRNLGLKKWYSVITASQLFENFNTPTQDLCFGAFTDCLYRFQQGNSTTEV